MTKKPKENLDEEKTFAFLCYLISIIGVLMVFFTKKDRKKHSIFHAKQGIVLFFLMILIIIITSIFNLVPIIGQFMSACSWFFFIILWIIGMINSFSDKEIYLPLIGKIGNSFNF